MSAAVKVLVAGGVVSLGLMGLALFLPAAEPPAVDLEPQVAPARATGPVPTSPARVPRKRVRVAAAAPVGSPTPSLPEQYEEYDEERSDEFREPLEASAEAPEAKPERPPLEVALETAHGGLYVQERLDAVRWLGEHAGPDEADTLRLLLQEEQNPQVRQGLDAALRQLQGRFPGQGLDAPRTRPLPSGRGGPSHSAQ